MGLEEDGVGIFHVRKDRFAEALVTRSDIFGCFYGTQKHFGLGMNARRQIDAGDGEGGGVWRMRMNHRSHIGAGFVDGQMEIDFAGALAGAADLLAFQIDGADVVGLESALGNSRGRAEDAIFADAIGMVAFVAGAKSFLPDAAADVAHLLLEFPFADGVVAVAVPAVFTCGCSVCHGSPILRSQLRVPGPDRVR